MTKYDIEENVLIHTHNNRTCYDAAPWTYHNLAKNYINGY